MINLHLSRGWQKPPSEVFEGFVFGSHVSLSLVQLWKGSGRAALVGARHPARVSAPHGQGLALPVVEVPLCAFLQAVRADRPLLPLIPCWLGDGVLCSITQLTNEDVQQSWSQCGPQGMLLLASSQAL